MRNGIAPREGGRSDSLNTVAKDQGADKSIPGKCTLADRHNGKAVDVGGNDQGRSRSRSNRKGSDGCFSFADSVFEIIGINGHPFSVNGSVCPEFRLVEQGCLKIRIDEPCVKIFFGIRICRDVLRFFGRCDTIAEGFSGM